MLRILAVLCAVALLGTPGNGQAKESEQTVRLVIECSPKTADAIQHLLKGLPAKVYRAEPVGVKPAPSKKSPAFDPRKPPTGVVSVLPIWNTIDAAVKGANGVVVTKLVVSARAARMTVTAPDEAALQGLRQILSSSEVLRTRARNSRHVVEPGAVVRTPNGVRGDLNVSFRPMPNDENGRVDTPGIDRTKMSALIHGAKMRPFRVGREQRDENRGTRSLKIGTEWVFEESSLTNLHQLVKSLHDAKGLVPTELRWALREGDEALLIQRPSIRIEQWLGN